MVLVPAYHCYNILLLAPFNGPSHWLFLSHFIRQLDSRGHAVTAITGIPLSGKISSNYSEILMDPAFNLEGACMICHILILIQISNFHNFST